MKLLPTLALLLLTALPTFARLGETKAECEARYGKADHTLKSGIVVYKKAGMDIMITFSKDKAVKIIFSKPDPEHPDKSLAISKAECDALLKANNGGGEWKEAPTSLPKIDTWSLGDDKAMATYEWESKMLSIVDMAFMMNPPPNEEETKKLDGF